MKTTYTFKNTTDGIESVVTPLKDGRWSVALRDTDADKTVRTVRLFGDERHAIEYAKSLVDTRNLINEKEIERNWLYAPVLREINKLYLQHDCPAAPDSGPTTGEAFHGDFGPDTIGDWGGREEEVVEQANKFQEAAYRTINRGSYPYYYEDEAFILFADEAERLLLQFDASEAFDRLCNEWENNSHD